MNRNWLNFVVNAVTALIVLWLIYTGLLLYFVLPPGSGHRGLILLGLDRHGWGDVHFWTSVAVLGLVLFHVALHWDWVCTMAGRMVRRGRRGPASKLRRNLAGLVAILAAVGVIVGGLLLAQASIEQGRTRPGRHHRRGRIDHALPQPDPNFRVTPQSNTITGRQRPSREAHATSQHPY